MQHIIEILSAEGSEEDILVRAASVNYLADFSIAQALVAEAKRRGLKPLPADKFEVMPGKGAKALIGGMEVRVGSPKLLIEERIAIPVSLADKITAYAREGKLVIAVLSGRSFSGFLVLSEKEEPIEQEPIPVEAEPIRNVQKYVVWLIALTCVTLSALFLW